MSLFSLSSACLISLFFSIPIWSLLFGLAFVGSKLSNVFVLACVSLSLIFNVFDLVDLELEFLFCLFLFVYVSAILILFLFAFLALPFNTHSISQSKLPYKIINVSTKYININIYMFCLFWVIFENIDLLAENYLDKSTDIAALKTHLNSCGFFYTVDCGSWLGISSLDQMLFYSNFSKKIELEGLSWAFIETHGGALLITITALIMTLFGTIYWLRKSDVIEN